ncbi:MAG TPA: SGNH/GDSL hydrolase family protein [Rhodanobacter sp.]|nr:SGNH/GDSL hydrolase family protein [Rhodanobacter sp.]
MTPAPPPLRYLALGDSYTIGEAVAADARWPALLVQNLRQAGVIIGDPRIVAVTGWTTDELAQGMAEAELAPPHDLVTLQIGVNNQYRGRPADEYHTQFTTLLQQAIQLGGNRPGRVVVVSIPDWGVTRFAREQGRDPAQIAVALDHFNRIAADEAGRTGAHFVDITGISRAHPGLVADDGLHPSAAQYALWVRAIEPLVSQVLRSRS